MIFVSHNLATVRYVSDVLAVMYLGRIVEVGPTDAVVADPQHPYTPSSTERQSAPTSEGLAPSSQPREQRASAQHGLEPLAAARDRYSTAGGRVSSTRRLG